MFIELTERDSNKKLLLNINKIYIVEPITENSTNSWIKFSEDITDYIPVKESYHEIKQKLKKLDKLEVE